MREDLECLVRNIIQGLEHNQINERVDVYTDYKSPYTVLKPKVKVKVELTSGKIAEIDVTDYFEGAVK